MPDLTSTALANNFNRAQDPNSQYGTRRLQFYKIEVAGYDIFEEPGWETQNTDEGEANNPDTYRVTYNGSTHDEFLESPKSIFYPILRGIAQVGEIYYNGEPDTDTSTLGPETSTYLLVALSEDTIADQDSQLTAGRLVDAIRDSIANFSFDTVLVSAVAFRGIAMDEVPGAP